MEDQEKNFENTVNEYYRYKHPVVGRVLGGLILVGIGAVLILQKTGSVFPQWLFSWQMLLIVIGFYIGARHLFRGVFWLIPMLVGGVFLTEELIPGFNLESYLWPIVIVIIGLFMIFRPKRRFRNPYWKHRGKDRHFRFGEGFSSSMTNDRLEEVHVFSGTKKKVISKDFKGGELTCVFGGAEIDLSQADINGKVHFELNLVFGGAKLIIPPHWQLQTTEIVTVMGGVEDKRPGNDSPDPDKILVLSGNSVFGGISISSY